jgi:hypothetical protein
VKFPPCPVEGCDGHGYERGVFCAVHWRYLPGNLRYLYLEARHNRRANPRRYQVALALCCEASERARHFVEDERDHDPRPDDPARSDVFAPGWKPGYIVRRKAVARAYARGETFEQALQAVVDGIKRWRVAHQEWQRRQADEDWARREQIRHEAEQVYPEPRSVRDIPVGFEVQRRRH